MERIKGRFSSFSSSSSSSPSSASLSINSNQLSVGAECWLLAEQSIREILFAIQPTVASEQRRAEVIDYLQRLIKGYYGTEVLPFGSVPLKTYLPDGDIDLTTFGPQNVEEELAIDICKILKGEYRNATGFVVKDVQHVRARVKIVKCTVQNIAVDISFNQMAGLSALCFLEQVDQLIGKDHLFKRSIILVKAWCYYESRILGAQYGLISTYALETLVLYIINRFHSSLNAPLAVLHCFLDYYGTFDWDKFCLSINGPLLISSPTGVVVMAPEDDGRDLLLTDRFLKNVLDAFSLPTRRTETTVKPFPVKFLNIMDPLKENNNLGRSVNKGNFIRIKCAFSYGARHLGEVLALPRDRIGEGLNNFFRTTLILNGRGRRSDVQFPSPGFGPGRTEVSDLNGDFESYFNNLNYGQWLQNCTSPFPVQPRPPPPVPPVRNWTAQREKHDFFPTEGNNFAPPMPYFHPNAAQVSSAALRVEEPASFIQPGAYIPLLNVEEQMRLNWRGTGTFIPDRSGGKGILREKPKFQGSSSCSPDAKKSYQKQGPLLGRRKNVEPNRGLPLKFPPNTTPLGVPSEMGGSSSSFNLALEDFPILPGSKIAGPSATLPSGGPNEFLHAQESPRRSDGIGFGSFGFSPSHSPSSSCSPESMNQGYSGFQPAVDPTLGAPTTATPEPSESVDNHEEKVPEKLYKLEDVEEFPPLSG